MVGEPPERVPGQQYGILAALCPPAKAHKDQMFNNMTSDHLYRILKQWYFIFIDLFPITTGGYHNNINQVVLGVLIVQRRIYLEPLLKQWIGRIEAIVKCEASHGNKHPTIIWSGETANNARKWLSELNLITYLDGEFVLNEYNIIVKMMDIAGIRCFSIEDAVHPSAHMHVDKIGQGAGLGDKRMFE